MLFGSSSVFYNDMYEEGLIDSSFGAYYTGKKILWTFYDCR